MGVVEVIDAAGLDAMGWLFFEDGTKAAHIWNANSGVVSNWINDDLDITGPYVEPPKLLECWMNVTDKGEFYPYSSHYAADEIGSHTPGWVRVGVHMMEVKK